MIGGKVLKYYSDGNAVVGSTRYNREQGLTRLGPIARQAMRTGGWANPSSMPELKFVDAATSTTLATTGLFTSPVAATLLNGLTPGSTATTRIGRKIVMKSLYLRYSLSLAATSTGGSPVRIIIFYDKQANATLPAITDLLEVSNFNSTNNLSNRDRFVVLCDHVSEPVSVQNNFTVTGSLYKKLSLETMFNTGAAGTIGDITSGSVFITFATAVGGIGVAGAELNWRTRIRFDDQ